MGNPDRRQFNVRIPSELWQRVETRRLTAGLSRDEWTRRALEHLLATTQVLATPASTTHEETPYVRQP